MSEKMKLRAGPPICFVCGSVKEAWTRKFTQTSGHQGLLWLCPNFCEINKANEAEESKDAVDE